MFTSVLVPLDGSELAEGILPYVAQIAGGVGARITLITVVDPEMLEIPAALRAESSGGRVPAQEREQAHTRRHEESGPFVQQILENVERRAEANLREVAESLREQGAAAEGRIVFGTPAEQIAKFSEDEGCDLIAMSTHGRNLIARGVLGSVTDKVIHSVSVPVLAITPERARKYHHEPAAQMTGLLAPLDGSELAEAVLPYVESLALAMRLRVTLVKVLRLDASSSAYLEGMAYPADARIQAEVEEEATEYLGEVASTLKDKGVQVDTSVVLGTPASAIADMAHEHDYDIIAMATHGRSGISRWVLGSVTETLVRTSGNPVLVIPPQG